MVKTRRILLTLALCVTMLFGVFEAELNNFDKNFATSNDKLKFHHQLTSLYIQSMMNDDDEGKKELLKRLIISSKALNLDASTYQSELNALNNKAQKPRFVLRSTKVENGVSLALSENLAQKDLRVKELKEKGNYRYIIDFDASLDGGRKEFDFDEAQILLAQFDKKTTRLVLHAKDELKYSLQSKDGVLKLNFTPPIKAQKPNLSQNSKPNSNSNSNQSAKSMPKLAPPNATKPVLTAKKPTQSAPKPAKKDTLYILKSLKSQNGIELVLDDELDEEEIRQFHMKDKGIFRKVVSFEAALDGGRKQFSFGNDTITLVQYSAKVVRVVFSSKSDFEIRVDNKNKRLFLGFDKENSAPSNSSANSTKSTAKPAKNTPKSTNTKNKIIVIDAGHGGKDGGAVGNGGKWVEKNIVLSVSLKIGDELKKKGYKVFYTRTTDKFINLRDRTKIANDKKANLFVSIHANAAVNATKAKSMQGIETFFLSPARSERSKEVAEQENKADFEEANFFLKQNFLSALSREKIIASNRLAIDIQKNILSAVRKKYKVVDGGVREAPFWVLVGAQDMPAVLIEIGYISHNEEGKRLLNKAYQELLAQGIARGIENYFRNNANE